MSPARPAMKMKVPTLKVYDAENQLLSADDEVLNEEAIVDAEGGP